MAHEQRTNNARSRAALLAPTKLLGAQGQSRCCRAASAPAATMRALTERTERTTGLGSWHWAPPKLWATPLHADRHGRLDAPRAAARRAAASEQDEILAGADVGLELLHHRRVPRAALVVEVEVCDGVARARRRHVLQQSERQLLGQLPRRVEAGERVAHAPLEAEAAQQRLEAHHKVRRRVVERFGRLEQHRVELRGKLVRAVHVVELGARRHRHLLLPRRHLRAAPH
mmetsp:Transcript_24201/g.62377  ORF Transcript_24201/g.62377 Transcript_24201/m.62377 type:complete len:229 (+) Transcript_24201:88-774(+)